jgi:hypothetical protein
MVKKWESVGMEEENHQYWNLNCTGSRSDDEGTGNTNKCPDGSVNPNRNSGCKCQEEWSTFWPSCYCFLNVLSLPHPGRLCRPKGGMLLGSLL